MYPTRVRYSCLTRIHAAQSAAEQRYVVRAPMVEVDAAYRNLTAADQGTIDTFFDSQKGAYDATWTLDFNGRTHTAMRFLEDEIRWEETLPNRWSTRLQSRGVHPALISPPSSLPALPSGAVTQRPWSKRRKYETSMADMESGSRHSLSLRGGGLTGFSTLAARAWDIQMPSIPSATAILIADYFMSVSGRFGLFTFTDPDTAIAYTDCRFGSDDLEVRYNGYNNCGLSFVIEKN